MLDHHSYVYGPLPPLALASMTTGPFERTAPAFGEMIFAVSSEEPDVWEPSRSRQPDARSRIRTEITDIVLMFQPPNRASGMSYLKAAWIYLWQDI